METADLSHHISRRFNEDLERVRSKVLAMGGFVEQQLQKAITALTEGDSTLGESVALHEIEVIRRRARAQPGELGAFGRRQLVARRESVDDRHPGRMGDRPDVAGIVQVKRVVVVSSVLATGRLLAPLGRADSSGPWLTSGRRSTGGHRP